LTDSEPLIVAPRPRGGDWLANEVEAWKKAGIDVVVSLMTSSEAEELELKAEAELCRAKGIEFVSLPIPDRGLPPSQESFVGLARQLEARLAKGTRILLHCRAGIGRSGMLAATVLILAGVAVEAALKRIQTARGCPVPDTGEQRDWILSLSHRLRSTEGGAEEAVQRHPHQVLGRP
jgi:protein-tyrosine phosphatase